MSDYEEKSKSSCKSCMNKLWQMFFQKDIDLIQEAIRKGNIEKIKYFHMIKKMNFKLYNKLGDSPLLMATRYQKLDILKYIMKKVAVIKEDKSFMGDTALMIATFNNDMDTVRYLVEEEKVDVNCRDNKGYTPFIAACANNYFDLVVYFKFIAKCDTTIRGFDKQSAAHRAAFYGNQEVLLFLDSYTNVKCDQPDKRGNLPIHYAAINNHFSVCRYLMSKDEDLLEYENKENLSAVKILKNNIEKMRKLKIPTSEVKEDEIRNYMRNPDAPPFKFDNPNKKGERDENRKATQKIEQANFRLGRSFGDISDEEKKNDLGEIQREDEEKDHLKNRRLNLPPGINNQLLME